MGGVATCALGVPPTGAGGAAIGGGTGDAAIGGGADGADTTGCGAVGRGATAGRGGAAGRSGAAIPPMLAAAGAGVGDTERPGMGGVGMLIGGRGDNPGGAGAWGAAAAGRDSTDGARRGGAEVAAPAAAGYPDGAAPAVEPAYAAGAAVVGAERGVAY